MTWMGSSNWGAEPADHGLHGQAQPVGVQRSGDGDAQLHRVDIVVVAADCVGVEQQSLLQRGERQDIGDVVLFAQLVDLLLVQARRDDIGWGQPTSAASDVCTDSRQGVEPQLAEPADLRLVDCRRRPGPGGVQVRPDLGVQGAGVEFDGVPQRHWNRRGRRGDRETILTDLPQLVGQLSRAAPDS
ncbi:hypothetical protein [Mycobacterium genavense]|uniref:hypothetical protein n=1 Tax=Mycobacterium genavense TaxID=36812 RepID=UPI000688CCE4